MKKDLSSNLDYILASSGLFPMQMRRENLAHMEHSNYALDLAKKGLDAFEKDQFELALDIYAEAIAAFPDAPFFYACRYYTGLHVDVAQDGIHDYRALARLDRIYCDFIFYLLKSAEDQFFESSVDEVDSSSADALYAAGKRLREEGEIDYAIAVFTAGITKFNENAKFLIQRGGGYLTSLRYDLAYRDLYRAIDLSPESALAHFSLGMIYDGVKEYDTALAFYDNAISLPGADVRMYAQRAGFHSARKNLDRALNDYTRCIELDNQNPDYFIDRSFIHEEVGNYAAALQDTSEAIALDPQNSEVYLHRADIKVKLGDYDGAELDRNFSQELGEADFKKLYQEDDFDKIDGWDKENL
ncbi:tetratricopeptide repeat protein [Sphingobacterium sp. JB170]|uniref:tetratricopeptide repeat protein n=1 Tax=Sphingobacterium sp. JB170 TaxID=1434842 RepID=UPI000B35A35A|nr:tetratricopeptide repeat protein [Sphingobacterium sp. JB170]